MLYSALLAATSILAIASAQQAAIVTVQTSHGGAGNDLTNTTITVPLSQAYTNTAALNQVSTLFLTGAVDVPVYSITCTPYRYANASNGPPGATGPLPFTSSKPSLLSTNDVVVGSIVCVTTAMASNPSAPTTLPPPMTSSSSSSNLSIGSVTASSNSSRPVPTYSMSQFTSTYLTTVPASAGSPAHPETVTSVFALSTAASGEPSTTIAVDTSAGASPTMSSSPSLGSNGAARGLSLPPEVYGGLALAGLGLAFVL